jgi:hypothetical protein
MIIKCSKLKVLAYLVSNFLLRKELLQDRGAIRVKIAFVRQNVE